jgi:nitrogen regulatory protein P-II 1
MKYVLAFIPANALHRFRDTLISKHIHGMTASEARGFGQEHDTGNPEYRDIPGQELVRKMRLEIVCHDEEVEAVLGALYAAGHTGHAGDGKVFVLPVLDALRLKTGERGPSALGPTFKSSK